jgi:hypothetical protein
VSINRQIEIRQSFKAIHRLAGLPEWTAPAFEAG